MPAITLSDEAQRAFPFSVRPLEVAQAISSGPGRSALALITEPNVEGMVPSTKNLSKISEYGLWQYSNRGNCARQSFLGCNYYWRMPM